MPDSFANPHLWPLLLLAVIPLLIHLLDRRRARPLDWPAMRFFLLGSQRRLRWIRWREALLIATRSAALLAFTYALLRPQETREAPAAGDAAGRGVVLVADTSYSMTARDDPGGPTRLERARALALELLGELRPRDPVRLIHGGGRLEEHGGPAGFLSPAEAERVVRALGPRGGVFRLDQALDRALVAAAALPVPVREIHVLTDLQASSFPDSARGRWRFLARRLEATAPRPTVSIADCGGSFTANSWVAALEREDLLATTSWPVTIHARVESRAPSPPAPARWSAAGRLVKEEVLPAGTRGSWEMRLDHVFPRAGSFVVEIELPRDGLPADDRRWLPLEVCERLEVLVLEDPSREGGGPGRYCDLALLPRLPGLEPLDVPFRPRRASALPASGLERYGAAVLTGSLGLAPGDAARLEAWVGSGSGLVIFAGAAAAEANEMLHRGGRGLLPARVARRREAPAGAPFHPSGLLLSHPALSIFRDPQEGDLTRVPVRAFRDVENLAAGATVLARIDGASPWIVEHRFGRGRVVLVTTAADPADSDLVETPLFLPLLSRLVLQAAGGGGGAASVSAGEPLECDLGPDPGGEARVTLALPGGAQEEIAPLRAGGRILARREEAHEPGVYRFQLEPRGTAAVRAVHVDPRESSLERAGPSELSTLEGVLGARLRPGTSPARDAGRRTTRVEHWPLGMGLALLALLVELALAHSGGGEETRIRPRRRSEVTRGG